MQRCTFHLFRSILLVALLAFVAWAQVSSSLSGVVTDPSGAVIQGAVVTVKQDATGQEFKTTTSTSGNFTLPSMSVGTYTITITAQGFKTAVVQDVKIDAGTPANVNVALEVGGANESVVVQGGAEIVQSQTANITTTVQSGQ
ncbi:MAG TPA: carboxypeptidase-like regulatory domain-containing protein, partial [Blastocatellia bacterium]|nr:carboxypeptidase-like regulatory domain-containing protein [Blastocatellia bacterium]